MSDQQEGPGLFDERPTPQTTHTQDSGSGSDRQRSETQLDRVLRMLLENDEVCGHAEFYAMAFVPRFSVHLHRLKKLGYIITKRPCDRPEHNHAETAWLYRIDAVPYELR